MALKGQAIEPMKKEGLCRFNIVKHSSLHPRSTSDQAGFRVVLMMGAGVSHILTCLSLHSLKFRAFVYSHISILDNQWSLYTS